MDAGRSDKRDSMEDPYVPPWGARAEERTVARTAMTGVGIALILTLALPASARQFFRYVDEHGVVHLTDSPSDRRYREYQVGSVGGTLRKVRHTPRRHASRYDPLIARAARRHGLPPALVKAVVRAESNFEPAAVSHKGAQGLMQLMPATAASLGVRDPLHPEENVRGGARYLREMIDRYGSWNQALAAYNAGPTAVDRYGGIPPYRETQEYVKRVLHYYRRYDGDFSR